MEKPIIRSIAFFLDRECSVAERIADCFDRVSGELVDFRRSIEKRGYKVFTTRIVLPEKPVEEVKAIAGKLEIGEHLVSLGSVPVEKISREHVEEIVDKGFYIVVKNVWRDPLKYSRIVSEIIHRVVEKNLVNGSRIAIGFHEEPVETPYFPDTVGSGESGIGFSFLYPDYARKYYLEHGSFDGLTRELEKHVYELKRAVEEFYGPSTRFFVDYSLSPWMENSVVDLLETMGYRLLEPGFNHGVYVLNDLIKSFVEDIGFASGFNEVMLPYAEDSKLIEAGGEGVLKAHHLLLYSSTCVAGPDMLVVPSSIDKLAKYILDTYSLWRVKKKPLALRAIPVPGEPGDTVSLDKFGKTYIIDY